MPKFQKKFTQPKEQEWVQFLEKHMPLYKQSAKKLSERKMPFDEIDIDMMNVAFHYLSTTDIDRYIKLDRTAAGDKVASIQKKYNLQPHDVSIPDLIELIKSGSTNHEDQLAKVYRLLFIFLTALMEKDYNGIIRQLTKLFVHQIEGALQAIIILKEGQSIGYLIAIFETFIVDKPISREIFDLKQMRNILMTDEQTEKMKLKESLTGTTLCELERVSDPAVKSKHVIVCVTGFLQEDQEKAEFWEHLIEYYKHAEIFAMSWNACTPTTFLSQGTFGKMA